jgi:acyl-CoA synthetase (AMP-forming)/AMP-acid ligase II
MAVPIVQVARLLFRSRFREARYNVVVGHRPIWGATTLDELRGGPWSGSEMARTGPSDPAAIIFTSGSTGPPKGVLYQHQNFDHQVTEIRDFYGIERGTIDLACFPLFGLFNAAMGATTVIPEMDPSHPASVDPEKIVSAIQSCGITQSFGSPAVWDRVSRYCQEHRVRLPHLQRVLLAGAPVSARLLARMKSCLEAGAEVHTPYGATEALPVASISATEVLGETARLTNQGAGTCVGRKFPRIDWKVIRAVQQPLRSMDEIDELPQGEIGELIVSGPVVTRSYATRLEANAWAKIQDNDSVWHRMGDVGYIDGRQRFWYCGRLSQRVLTTDGPMDTECCEAIVNEHPAVSRSALVGIGPPGHQRPVIIVEPRSDKLPRGKAGELALKEEVRALAAENPLTSSIHHYLLHPSLPVDVRHNVKISREALALWAAKRLGSSAGR